MRTFHSLSNCWAITFHSSKQPGIWTFQITCMQCFPNPFTCFANNVTNSGSTNLKGKWGDCCESPVARYQSVKKILAAGDITSLLLQCFLVTKGPTRLIRCSTLSGDIRRYLHENIGSASIVTHVPNTKVSTLER